MNLERLSELLLQLPGVGRRQADRFALFLAKRGPSYANELMRELSAVHQSFRVCTESYQIFFSEDLSVTTSPIVRDSSRSRAELMIVEKDSDIEPLERAGYRGQYFVLGALMPMIPKQQVRPRSNELYTAVQSKVNSGELREIIFGLSWNSEAEHTKDELLVLLEPLLTANNITISMLGRGLSTGSELEYADRATLQYALKSRQKAID